MGIIDFIKNAGTDLFGLGSSEPDPQKIKEMLQKALGSSIFNLDVTANDETITLTGSVASQEIKEKAILLAGNVKGVSAVNGDAITVPETTLTSKIEFYTVTEGDSLSKIASKVYGDSSKYQKLFEANKEIIKDPDLIYPGQKLRVPSEIAAL